MKKMFYISLSFLMILIFICLPSCVWRNEVSYEYSLVPHKQAENFSADFYKTTQELLRISVKQDTMDLLGKIILAGLPTYTIGHYLILPSQKEMFTSRIVGEVVDIQILPKDSILKMDSLYLTSHENYFRFFKTSAFITTNIRSYLYKSSSKTINKDHISHSYFNRKSLHLIVSLFDSKESFEPLLKKSSYLIEIPYLINNRTNAPFKMNIPINHMKKALENTEGDYYRANSCHRL